MNQAVEADSCRLQPPLEEVELNLRIEEMSDQDGLMLEPPRDRTDNRLLKRT